MVAQTARPVSIKLRAYAEAANYLVEPNRPDANDYQVIHRDDHGYVVDLDAESCTCADYARRGHLRPCKHVELAKLHVEAEAMCSRPDPAVTAAREAEREAKVLADRARLWD